MSDRRPRSVLFLFLFLLFSNLNARAGDDEGVTILSGTDPESADHDLGRVLPAYVRGARVFALAEPAHESSEFKRLQHRIVRHLVEKQGFRTLIVEQENRSAGPGRAILITHVSHGTKMRTRVNWNGMTANSTTGRYLDRELGDGYRVLAMSGYRVVGARPYALATAPESLDLALHERGVKTALIDLRGDFARSRQEWFIHAENGTSHPNGVRLGLPDHFDGVLYVDESPRGTPVLPWVDPFFG